MHRRERDPLLTLALTAVAAAALLAVIAAILYRG